MLVEVLNSPCNCCNKSVENKFIDVPLTDIKLSAFPVECECGYFYISIHSTVSFTKWKTLIAILRSNVDYLQRDIKLEEEFISLDLETEYSKKKLQEYQCKLEIAMNSLESNSIPVPNHLWKDTYHD